MSAHRASSRDDIGESSDNATRMGIMHLRKVFNEFTRATIFDEDKELKLYNMLPLFCKTFQFHNSGELIIEFPDILHFCKFVSKIMTNEIKKRGSNQSTEAASKNIVKFLEIDENEETSAGWMLLSAINIMANGDESLIQVMTNASVPSTLVKCLYLFFDLPELIEDDKTITDTKYNSTRKRILLQKMIVQVLVRLCAHPYPADELARMDDLSLLFSAITSQCPSYNIVWRKSAAEILMTLSRHGLTNDVITYLHNKGCVSLCIDNMQRSSHLQPLDVVEMVVSVFCFLKDSSEVSQVLLDDFKFCQGYLFLIDFIIKLDQEDKKTVDTEAAIRNLVLMTTSLCTCGYNELKVSTNNISLFKMEGFKIPQISSRGSCVRNLHAFQVLQTVFLKSNNTSLCCIVLEAISSIYHSDNANYFILESQNTLCQFSEVIYLKSAPVRERFFGLLKFVVFQLNFVPCKELISLSLLLKSNLSMECNVTCMNFFLDLLKHNIMFSDVYREVGVLEVIVNCLKKYKTFLEMDSVDGNAYQSADCNQIGELILEALMILLSGNNNNATVFRDSGGSKCIHDMVHLERCSASVLRIIKEMILNTGGEDDMLRLIESMADAPLPKIQLKIQILKSLVVCLRDSHRARTIFRKVNGFNVLIKTLKALENKWTDIADRSESKQQILMLHLICQVLTTAMRFEPANAKYFQQELCSSAFFTTLRTLGCFSPDIILKYNSSSDFKPNPETIESYRVLFTKDISTLSCSITEPMSLSFGCIVYRMLYSIALDNFENASIVSNVTNVDNIFERDSTVGSIKNVHNELEAQTIRSLMNMAQLSQEHIIVHPGVVLCMLQLLPSVEHSQKTKKGLVLQYYLAEVLKSLLRSERNQQIMCEAGMAGIMLKNCKSALLVEQHTLHLPLQYIFERLAVQGLQPKEFREFLRLGFYPDASIYEKKTGSSTSFTIPLTRIKTLVSMTTPRDFRAHGSYTLPPFVEMDMSSEGFGCIFLPSLAPQAIVASSTEIDGLTIGGIGTGDRSFPPANGLSYSTWFCVDKIGVSSGNHHCVRLLTLVRTINNVKEESYICLSILLSAKDKAIITSTNEMLLEQNTADWEPQHLENFSARVLCPYLLVEGQWHHLVVVLNKLTAKNSSFSLFIDGHHIHTQSIQYIASIPGNNIATSIHLISSVYAYIGTPPLWRGYSKLCWKQGVCHLIEDVLTHSTVKRIYALGPHYLGSLQAPHTEKLLDDFVSPLVPEEHVVFGLNARAVSNITLSKIRKVYSRLDCKAIAKQLGMNSHDNATPIKILHNSAGHLAGPARTFGGVMIGYLGIRCFSPNPVPAIIYTVGGCSVLLGIIAMSQNVEALYAGVKVLTCVIKSNKSTQKEMDRKRYYQTLGMILKRKKYLLNSHILHLTFNLVGTVNSGQESSAIPNKMSFQDLLCDFDIWLGAPSDLLKSLLEHLLELASESSEKRTNIHIMRDMQCTSKLLIIIGDVCDENTRDVLYNLLEILLGPHPRVDDLLLFGQHLICNIPQPGNDDDKNMEVADSATHNNLTSCNQEMYLSNVVLRKIVLRNRGLSLLHSLLFTARNTINTSLADDISKVLGTDWIMQFMHPHLHKSSVIWALRILVVLCSNEVIIGRYREGSMSAGYMRNTEIINRTRDKPMVSSHESTSKNPVIASISLKQNEDGSTQNVNNYGFSYLQWLLLHHINTPETYFLLTALIMGQPVKLLGTNHIHIDLDRIWTFLWGTPVSNTLSSSALPKMCICPEAVCILCSLVRKVVHTTNNAEWLKNHPTTLIQVMFSLYHNLPDFMSVIMSAEIISSLISILFPYQPASIESDVNSKSSSTEELQSHQKLDLHNKQDLTEHPVRKLIMDFLRVIAVDSFSLACNGKDPPIIDCILDAQLDNDSQTAKCSFLTEIIVTLMDHLVAADILVGEQAALPIVPLLHSHVQNIAPNVFYFTTRIIDKLWQGHLNKDPQEIFEFIIKLTIQAKRRTSALSLDQLYHSMNRCILYLLSRSTETVSEQMVVLETLHKLTTNRLIIFGAGNHELEFLGCLLYCLMQLIASEKIELDNKEFKFSNRTTKWHISPNNDAVTVSDDDSLNRYQGINLISNAASRVWEEIYVCKKPAIEEIFKISLTAPLDNAKAPDTTITREQILDSAYRLWMSYLDGEKRAHCRASLDLHNHIQSKIQKVTGNLTRLTSRSKFKKEDEAKEKFQPDSETIHQLNLLNLCLVKELWSLKISQHMRTMQHTQRYVYQEWLQSEAELFRERGLWGPKESQNFTKWMLDSTEGPCRMRKKMMKNDMFYIHYPYRPELELADQRQLKYKVATSYDSKEYYESFKYLPKDSSIHVESALESPSTVNLTDIVYQSTHEIEEHCDMEDDEEMSSAPDNQTLIRSLEAKEKISHIFRCARIQGLDTFEGLLLFGKENCYVIDGFTLMKNREIRDIDSLCFDSYDPILPNPGNVRTPHEMRQSSKFAYEDIREVHKRRYLLQPIALEVFSGDGRNFLLSFPRKVRNKVYQRLMTVATSIADNAQQSVAGQSRTANVEQTSNLFSSLIGETSVTQRWVRGEMSNFQYLMHLNTLAGRSYNDLMQYPVFPWILSDYESEKLDFSNPECFRDFSMPMGAQSQKRLEQFVKRYREWDDPHGETPPYFYGTHYSSAMIVCSYLVRLEPFTQHFLRLQGGHFDLADRMFHSIEEAWYSASKHNMADVKELIPEFFYLPEFLINSNNFDFGMKQNSERLNHVVLPPWSKGDPREFIRVHREALECDYVSQHLHLWIDLIFGYKQRGQAAIDASNVFHHLFYEGNVDIYSIDDPLKKNATIGFINNFGQIPKQLFRKAHPAKKIPSTRTLSVLDSNPIVTSVQLMQSNDKLFFHNLEMLKPCMQPIKELKGPVGHVIQGDKVISAVEQNKILIPPNYNRYIAWGYADHSVRVGMYDSDRVLFVCENIAPDSGEILACACPNSKTVIMAGSNSIVTVCDIDFKHKQLHVMHTLHGHTDAVTSLAASTAYNIIVSGSKDRSAIIWDMSRYKYVRQLSSHVGVVAAVNINELTGDIATCSTTWLYVWTINGNCLAKVNTSIGFSDRMQQILCVIFSCTKEWDKDNVIITGSTDGVVRVWSLDHVQIATEHKSCSDGDLCLEVETDQKSDDETCYPEEIGIVKSSSTNSILEQQSSKKFPIDKRPPGNNRVNNQSFFNIGSNIKAVSVDQHMNEFKSTGSEQLNVTKDLKSRNSFRWCQQLLFRTKLTMYTAYDRKDNVEPASITSLAISSDHRTVFVGDARGRVYSWSAIDQTGRLLTGRNMKNENPVVCAGCNVRIVTLSVTYPEGGLPK
ncbi:WD repeat and FYVE domain-containing protein 3 isoform X2 [Malaya genurostris]|uniref:WD repeat and FYVE domain-containing protein 3 isoform X2 n=1 Tax=Malaya genurostris TaxID=325434 RepID=UPI0026F3B2D0|nr:WD repeat and FYVE domain-containing protein 3 isoform X2 [Malaya genurostris]XP_058460936.1 WD repeat and FYVE domain-containing protein 3 isoform X2 [Malaya genurostris]